jgi:2-polyprenyl-3-methyl-5-hydroxy-6-metoxy-1,4-benzoquinol methylase
VLSKKPPFSKPQAEHTMNLQEKLGEIPRGHTARGVHRAILEYLIDQGPKWNKKNLLDLPCGQGQLMGTLSNFFPESRVFGADMQPPKNVSITNFAQVDASRPFNIFSPEKFDLITSVSGVMEFDNTLQFFEQCKNLLNESGTFVVSNDNVMTVRDRLSFFWLGKFRQYSIFTKQEYPTWKVITIYNMTRILQDAGFTIKEIRYCSVRGKDYFMLPLAIIIYPIKFLYIQFAKHGMPVELRSRMYPFACLLYRHYFIVCEKRVTESI